MTLRAWKNASVRALPLGFALGVSLPVAALVRVETSGRGFLAWIPRLRPLPDGGWPGAWSDAARSTAELQTTGFGKILVLLCSLAFAVWLAALAGTVLSTLRRVALERREWALHSAVGGSRRQLRLGALREGARVAILACVVGTTIAAPATHLLLRTLPPQFAASASSGAALLSSSWLVLAALLWTFVVVASAPLLLFPTSEELRHPFSPVAMRREGCSDGVRFLAAGQVAACVGIAACGALLLGGAPAVSESTLHYPHARDTLVLRVRLPDDRTVAGRSTDWTEIRATVGRLTGVDAVALTSPGAVLGHGVVDRGGAECAGCTSGSIAAPVTFGWARHLAVDPNFFDLLGVSVEPIAGSGVFIDRRLHRSWFQGTDVSERRVWLRGARPLDGPGRPIAGIADGLRPAGIRATREPIPAVYLPFAEAPLIEADVVVRASVVGSPDALLGRARRALDGAKPVAGVEPVGRLDRMLAAEMDSVRWLAIIAFVLAGAAFALALLGCGGAMMEHVRVRRAEIGLRRALGANRRAIARLVWRDTVRLVLAGGCVGTALAASANRALPSLIHGLEPMRPEVIVALAGLLAAVG
ncbi:MAG: FtsX-like permease family protein, partial [Gemmatimonadota bacterium]|nr:FtsX-like permease family protein [Gemmatimonadota bacterium]